MTKVRITVIIITLVIVGAVGYLLSLFARGYRVDTQDISFTPRGLLVANSDPDAAQVIVDGELKTATDATVSLPPGTYDVTIKKEGYLEWNKTLLIEKEVVTQINAFLFSSAPSLSALTFSGSVNPVLSPDYNKIAYAVPKNGLWVTETVNLPIGFNREPRQITDGDLTDTTWQWSPDSREILLTTKAGADYLLDASEFTTELLRENVTNRKPAILKDWEELRTKKLKAQIAKLPDELEAIFGKNAKNIVFSPDENKILYTATIDTTIPEGLVKPLPGASTQKQERAIKRDQKYVYDIKEDKNFEITGADQDTYWLPTSAHIILPQKDKIVIADYDGTNHQEVYSGSYLAPHAYPYSNSNTLIILTNLGTTQGFPNLYLLNLK
jgi:Tol biopolymer transport system component